MHSSIINTEIFYAKITFVLLSCFLKQIRKCLGGAEYIRKAAGAGAEPESEPVAPPPAPQPFLRRRGGRRCQLRRG